MLHDRFESIYASRSFALEVPNRISGLLVIALSILPLLVASPLPASSQDGIVGRVATLPPFAAHWVWVTDRFYEHTFLFDGDSGQMLGTIPSAAMLTPKLPLVSHARGEIYSVDLDYSRGRRGTRTDYVTIYDAETLDVKAEIVLPRPTSESNTSLHHAALLDGDRYLVVFSQFPTTVATVVDIASRRVVDEISIAGCAGVYAAGRDRFATLCGDGTVSLAQLDDKGELDRMTRSNRFFDVVEDPVSMAGVRLGSKWFFVTFAGVLHELDFSGATPETKPGWSLTQDAEREAGWRPGGLQPFAMHQSTHRLYAVMHQGGPGTHKDPGPEIWTFDIQSKARIGTIEVPNLAADFLGPIFGIEPDGFVHGLLRLLIPSTGVHSIVISQDEEPRLFIRNAELGVVALIDAESGEHLRNLEEVGISGPTLGVP